MANKAYNILIDIEEENSEDKRNYILERFYKVHKSRKSKKVLQDLEWQLLKRFLTCTITHTELKVK